MDSSSNVPLTVLKDYRDRQCPPLTQEDLARLVGASKPSVSRWEAGTRKVDTDLLPTVVKVTGIPAEVLRPDLAALFEPPKRSRSRARASSRAA